MIKTASLEEVLATRAKAVFLHRVNFQTVGYDNIEPMKYWCRDNCQGLWRCETHHALYWQFELDRDAMIFMLRWGTAEGNKIK